MSRTLVLVLIASVTLTGCARIKESPINPVNWFGRDRPAAEDATPTEIPPLIPARGLVQQVDSRNLVASVGLVQVTPTPEGSLVRATGTAGTAAFSAELVETGRDGSTLTFAFRVRDGNSGGARSISVAHFISHADLAGIRTIRVLGQSGAQVVRAR